MVLEAAPVSPLTAPRLDACVFFGTPSPAAAGRPATAGAAAPNGDDDEDVDVRTALMGTLRRL